MPAAFRAHRRLLVVAIVSFVVAFASAVFNSGVLAGFPPKPQLNHLQIAAATSHVNVDMPGGNDWLVRRKGAAPGDLRTLSYRAELYGRVMVSDPVLKRIEARCKIPAGQLSGLGRITANVPLALIEPDSERRASDIQGSAKPYRLEMQTR